MPGLSSTGFEKPSFAEIQASVEADLKASLGTSINLLSTSVFAAIVRTMSERYDDLWQAALDLYNGLDPDTAQGVLLGYLVALQGLTKNAATKSTVTLTVDLDATTTLTVGRLVSNPTTGVQFITTAEVTSTTAGSYSVAAEATVTGPVAALAGSLTQIDTPVTGWNSVTNALDAVAGSDVESDAALRLRRVEALAAPGSGTPEGARSDLAALSGVSSVSILENTTGTTDGNGLPPYSFEAILDEDGSLTDDQLAQAIYDTSKPLGTPTHGTDSGTATDTEGNTHTINFTKVADVNAYVDVTFTTNDDYPVDGDTQVAAAIAAFVLDAGQTLFASKIYDLVFNVTGVENITDVQVGTTPSPVGTSVVPTIREKVDLDSSRVTVTSS